MGWFDKQIKKRKQNDENVFEASFIHIAGSVMGQKLSVALTDDRQITKNAIDEVLKYYHAKSQDIPDGLEGIDEQLEFLLRPHGIMWRSVILEKKWYQDAIGAMLGIRKNDGKVVALIPAGISGYSYYDFDSGKRMKINTQNEDEFEKEAIAFYKPFPVKKMGISELIRYIAEALSFADYMAAVLAALAVAVVGLLIPKVNNILFSDVIGSESRELLLSAAVFLICMTISSLVLNSVSDMVSARINTKMNVTVQAAAMMRVISLPADFFKKYSAGELSKRMQYINELCTLLVSTVFKTGLTSVFSLIYITQVFHYAPSLAVPALLVIFATVAFSIASAFVQMGITRQQMELSSKESGMSFALISGIQKVKLSGAEKRVFARWGSLYANQAGLLYNPPMFLKMNTVISTAISLIGTIAIYYTAIENQVAVADYYAFHTAYGMVSGAFMSLAGVALTIAKIRPILEIVRPIFETESEVSEGKRVITRLLGGVEFNNVSFRYTDSMPNVVDNMSLKIRPGQYVAIVGTTGCGKSTLMRLILGFEKPQRGAVYIDGKDLNTIDLKSLRKKTGVVMQNGKLFQGDVFSNITISAPHLTMDEAWEAAEMAGIADDIRNMPMGMHTLISEGSGGISGGQRQRLMIARAIASKPKILMFDEATSALDNLTQKRVSQSLESLKCTRIVIAHRLSTIKQCDRIIVLDKGRIIEDGKYDELISAGGLFAELVARQRIDSGA